MSNIMTKKFMYVHGKDLSAFMKEIFRREEVAEPVGRYVAEGLVETSLRGVDSHGVRLFPHYIRALKSGRVNGKPNYRFNQTSPSTGILDADHTYGIAAGMEAAHKAIEMAKAVGTGQVVVKNSSHFAAAAIYALEIARHDMMATSYTHADSLMLTYGGTRPFLGTNPVCFAVPVEGEEPMCLDMATTQVSWNHVLGLREDGRDAKPGCCADEHGDETTDSQKARSLMPAGGYKGFGLSFMVEILCSMLSGMPYGRDICSMYKAPIEQKRLLGHFVTATRIDCFQDAGEFKQRMKALMDEIRNEPRKDPNVPIMVPNDPEKAKFKVRLQEGIPMKMGDWDAYSELARKYGVELKSV